MSNRKLTEEEQSEVTFRILKGQRGGFYTASIEEDIIFLADMDPATRLILQEQEDVWKTNKR
jgi:hypothetical protein